MQWWEALKGRPFYWVLDGSDPGASYYLLRHVAERPSASRGVRAARLALRESEAVASAKAHLAPSGTPRWNKGYDGPLWALRLLAEWEHPGDDEKIATCLDWALDGIEDSHPYAPELLLHAAAAFGFMEDERALRLEELVLERLEERRTSDAGRVLGAMALAARRVESADHEAKKVVEQALAGILKMGTMEGAPGYASPTYDRPDGLTLAESALRLGLRGEWLEPWIDLVVASQDEEGVWRAAAPGARRGSQDRWVSARALYVLRAWYGDHEEEPG